MREMYKDKNGNVIEAGMTLRHDDGELQKVYECGNNDLGFNATNEEFMEIYSNMWRQCYPLHQFDLSEWEIVEEK